MSGAMSHGSPWLRGPVWDGVWVLNMLWVAPLVLWLARGHSDPESSSVDLLYFGVTALFWIGHRFCSTWLAYCTEAYRPLLRAQPVRFVVLPLLVTVGCFAVFLPSDAALPWSREQRLVALAILDYALLTYHFAAQHFGALSLYRARIGRGACAYTRRMDRLYALGAGGLLVFVADVLAGGVEYQELWIDPLLIPAWFSPQAREALREGATLLLLGSTATMLLAELCAPRRSLPHMLYVLGIAVMVAVALRPGSLFLFLVVSSTQHWILAMGLASRMPAGEPAPKRGALRHAVHWMNTRPWALLFFLMALSVCVLPLFEVEANRQGGTYYGERIFGAVATGLSTSSWVPLLVALGFSTGFVHYILDRSIYRLSDPQVRSAARGLLAPNGGSRVARETVSSPHAGHGLGHCARPTVILRRICVGFRTPFGIVSGRR